MATRHDLFLVLLVFGLAWLLLGYGHRDRWGYYGWGSGGLFLLILIALLIFGVL